MGCPENEQGQRFPHLLIWRQKQLHRGSDSLQLMLSAFQPYHKPGPQRLDPEIAKKDNQRRVLLPQIS